MTADRLAPLLDDALRPYLELLRSPDDQNGKIIRGVAARLAAAGVTVAPKPADEPSCCELACYEDPGCACDGCQLAATPAPAPWERPGSAECLFSGGHLWESEIGGRCIKCSPPRPTPAPALDVERIVRQTLGHVMSRVRLDLMAGAIDQTYSPAEVAVMVRQAAEAAAIARAYEEEEGR